MSWVESAQRSSPKALHAGCKLVVVLACQHTDRSRQASAHPLYMNALYCTQTHTWVNGKQLLQLIGCQVLAPIHAIPLLLLLLRLLGCGRRLRNPRRAQLVLLPLHGRRCCRRFLLWVHHELGGIGQRVAVAAP